MAEEIEGNEAVDNQNAEGVEGVAGAAGAQADANQGANNNQEGNQQSDADKIVEKLQKRIGKEQSEKNDFKDKYEAAMKQIEALQQGKDPNAEPDKPKEESEVEKLKKQIARRDMRDQARQVITEAGFSVPNNLLEALVVDDDQQTLANVKAVIEYTNSVQGAVRDEFRKGKTPRKVGKAAKPITKEAFDKMTPTEQLSLGVKDPELYAKLLK